MLWPLSDYCGKVLRMRDGENPSRRFICVGQVAETTLCWLIPLSVGALSSLAYQVVDLADKTGFTIEGCQRDDGLLQIVANDLERMLERGGFDSDDLGRMGAKLNLLALRAAQRRNAANDRYLGKLFAYAYAYGGLSMESLGLTKGYLDKARADFYAKFPLVKQQAEDRCHRVGEPGQIIDECSVMGKKAENVHYEDIQVGDLVVVEGPIPELENETDCSGDCSGEYIVLAKSGNSIHGISTHSAYEGLIVRLHIGGTFCHVLSHYRDDRFLGDFIDRIKAVVANPNTCEHFPMDDYDVDELRTRINQLERIRAKRGYTVHEVKPARMFVAAGYAPVGAAGGAKAYPGGAGGCGECCTQYTRNGKA